MFLDARPLLDGACPTSTPDGFPVGAIADVLPSSFSPPVVAGGALRAAACTPPLSGLYMADLSVSETGRVSIGWDGYDDPGPLTADVHHNLSLSHLAGDGYVLHVVATPDGSDTVFTLGIGVDVIANAPDIFTMLHEVEIPEPVAGDIFAMGYTFGVGSITLTAYRNGSAVFTITDATWTDPGDFSTSAVPLLQNAAAFYGRVSWVHHGPDEHFVPDADPASVTQWAALSARVAALEAS